MVTAELFATTALSLKGTRFQHHGRTRAGLDCAGLVFLAAWECGLHTLDFRGYEKTPKSDVVLAAVTARCADRAWHEWHSPGRVVVLRQADDGEPRHFAVTLGEGLAIHQESRARVVDLREALPRIHSTMLLQGVAP